MQPEFTSNRVESRDILLLAGYLLFCFAFISMINCVSLTFPIPWPDEASFLWQAIAVQEHNQLFAPQINAERDVMWMPPGYAIVMGLIFKLTGFSLPLARSMSALFVILAFGTFLLVFRRHKAAPWLLVLVGLFLLSSRVILAGNFARMESLMMLQVFVGVLLIVRGNWYSGLALVALSPMVHPNGLHFCLPVGVLFLWHLYRRDKALLPGAMDVLYIGCVVAVWLGYAWYVSNHWSDFVSDMQFQADAKNKLWTLYGGLTGQMRKLHNLFTLAVLLPSLIFLRSDFSRFLILIAISLLSLNIVSIGLSYAVFEAAAMLVSSMLCVVLLVELVGRRWQDARILQVVAAASVFLLVGLQLHWGYLEKQIGDPASLAFEDVKADTHNEWMSEEESATVSEYLLSLPASTGDPLTVMFLPSADGLLLNEFRSNDTRFVAHVFHKQKADIIIHHEHPAIPNRLRRLIEMILVSQTMGGDSDYSRRELYLKNENIRWTAYEATGAK